MSFGWSQMRVLTAHLLDRPSMSEVIHGDLRNPDAGDAAKACRLARHFLYMGVGNLHCHPSYCSAAIGDRLVSQLDFQPSWRRTHGKADVN